MRSFRRRAYRRPATVAKLTLIGSAVSNSDTISVPVGAQAGDIAVLVDFAHNGGSGVPTNVLPSGFVELVTGTQDAGSNDTRITVSCKTLAGGETTLTGMNQTNDHKVLLVFRPDAVINTLTPGSWVASAVPSNPAAQTVTAAAQPVPLIVIGAAGVEAATAGFSTASPAFDGTVATADSDLVVGYKIYNAGATPADHTIDMNDLGDANALVSGFIAAT